MAKFILKRCLWMVITLLATAFIIFTILYFTPGDPARHHAGRQPRPLKRSPDSATSELGLDRPYLVQLGDFLYKSFYQVRFWQVLGLQGPGF